MLPHPQTISGEEAEVGAEAEEEADAVTEEVIHHATV